MTIMIEPIFLVHDRIERNHASCMAGQYEVRRDYVTQIPNKLGRRLELRLLDGINAHPRLTAQVIGRHLTGSLEYAGGGSLHTVVRDGDSVTKVHRRSAFVSEGQRHAMREQHTRQHQLLRRHLGGYVLRQAFRVDTHPLNNVQRAILSEQPVVAFEELGLFAAHKPEINLSALTMAEQQHPGIESALHDFAMGGKRLYEATGMLVDTSGLGNIVLAPLASETGLVCLDGLPIAEPNAGDVQRIMSQIELVLQHTI
jgi:hypothetical protein